MLSVVSVELSESTVSSKACSRSWVMKSELLSNKYISLGVRQTIVFEFIQVASFGADQFNLGTTLPPSSAIVLLIALWIFRQPAVIS